MFLPLYSSVYSTLFQKTASVNAKFTLSFESYALCLWKMLLLAVVLPDMLILWENVAEKQNLYLSIEKTMKKIPRNKTHAVCVSISDSS